MPPPRAAAAQFLLLDPPDARGPAGPRARGPREARGPRAARGRSRAAAAGAPGPAPWPAGGLSGAAAPGRRASRAAAASFLSLPGAAAAGHAGAPWLASFAEAAKKAEAESRGDGAEDAPVPVHHKGAHGGIRMMDVYGMVGFVGLSSIVGAINFALLQKSVRKRPQGAADERSGSGESRGPSLTAARAMSVAMRENSNDTLVVLAELGSHEACAERLIRDIMRVESIEWAAASNLLVEIDEATAAMYKQAIFPYMALIGIAITSGIISIPMVYNKQIAEFCNYYFVLGGVEEPENLKTIWEVSSWSWNWMEPLLGTASFSILCIQLTRSMMEDIGMLAFHERMKVGVADRLAAKFPQYDAGLVRAFAKTSKLHGEDRDTLLD